MKLILLKGLPASGKSTWAKEMVLKDVNHWKRVNKDEIRNLVHAGKWTARVEKFVEQVEYMIAEKALVEGKSVIVDNTNFHSKHAERYKQLAKKHDAQFETKMFEATLEECISRDLKRPNPVGEAVIRQMHKQYVAPPPESYEPPKDARNVVLCDIDGTVATMKDRGPFDWKKVGQDLPNEPVVRVVRGLLESGHKVIYVSGRDGSCRTETMEWLQDKDLLNGQTELFMRAADDNRKDVIIKKEIFDEHIRNQYRVLFVIDDRKQVVEMWRSLGLTCFQVAEGDF